jgi:predicted dehydrogenase
VGVIGAGDIARTAHLPVLSVLEGARLAWVTDLDRGHAEALGRSYKLPHFVVPRNAEELPEADVILLACPYGVRMPYYEALRRRECAIYVEKPLARTAAEHREICAMFPGYALTSGLMMRCWSSNLMARQAIESRIFGAIRCARFATGRPGLVTGGRYYLDPRKGGGGMLAEFGIHGVDSLLFIAHAVAARVDEVRVDRDGDLDLHTEARLTLELAGGATARCEITVTGIENVVEGVELEFDHAIVSYVLPNQGWALHGDAIDMDVLVRPRAGGRSYRLSPGLPDSYPGTKFQMFHEYWSRFLAGVRNRKENLTTATDAYLTTEVIERIAQEGGR